MAEGQDENMAEELGGALAGEMDVDEPDVGSPSGHGVYDSEAGPSRVESLYEAHFEHEQVGQSHTVDPGYELGGRPDRRGRQCPSPHQG